MSDLNLSRTTSYSTRHSLAPGVNEEIYDTTAVEALERETGDYMLRNDAEVLNSVIEPINAPDIDIDNEEEEGEEEEEVSETEVENVDSQTSRPSYRSDEKEDLESANNLSRITKTKTRFFSPNMKDQRKKVFTKFLQINFFLMIFIFVTFIIFWGSLYRTEPYLHRLDFLAVIQDDPIIPGMDNVTMAMTAALPEIISQVPGHWYVYNTTTFTEKYIIPNNPESIEKKVIELVFEEVIWAGINSKPNATINLFNSVTNTSLYQFNATAQFEIIYESSRDLVSSKSLISPLVDNVELAFKKFYASQYLPSFANNITSSRINIANLAMAGEMDWYQNDYRPFYDRILLTVTQISCVYILVLTVFQFMNFGPLHAEMATMIFFRGRVIYRILVSFITNFFLSLWFCTITAMFQVDFTKAFGRGGFIIYWMSTWLFMLACSGINENVVSIIFATGPQYLGFWVLGFVALNICSGFFPFSLDNPFYRFGYMMPIHNLIDIYHVIFFNTSRWKLGRNYGILAAWVVVNTVTLPLFMKWSSKLIFAKMKRQATAKAGPSLI